MHAQVKFSSVVGALSLLLMGVPVAAHHAFSAEFDENKPIALLGTVSKVEWTNPHSWIHLNVKAPDGTVQEWMIEAGTPGTLLRRGMTKAALPIGSEIKITGYRARNDAYKANGSEVVFADGRTVFVGAENTGAPYSPGIQSVAPKK